jgi:hypothetical protein
MGNEGAFEVGFMMGPSRIKPRLDSPLCQFKASHDLDSLLNKVAVDNSLASYVPCVQVGKVRSPNAYLRYLEAGIDGSFKPQNALAAGDIEGETQDSSVAIRPTVHKNPYAAGIRLRGGLVGSEWDQKVVNLLATDCLGPFLLRLNL